MTQRSIEAVNSATEELLKIAGDNNTTPQMIENLINLGADVNAEDYWTGWTPLRYAARCNTNPDVVNVL
ncbi:MAG: hypothetical protein IJG39_02730, partial [Synergistaceae bacterium]|nr:hypothetical protein [Synergistaceae bacterium]